MSWLAASRSGRWAAILHRAGVALLRNFPTLSGIAVDGPRRLEETNVHVWLLRGLAVRLSSGSGGPIDAYEPELGDDVRRFTTGSSLDHPGVRVLQQLQVAGLVQDVAALETSHVSAVLKEFAAEGTRPVVPAKGSNRRRGRHRRQIT